MSEFVDAAPTKYDTKPIVCQSPARLAAGNHQLATCRRPSLTLVRRRRNTASSPICVIPEF